MVYLLGVFARLVPAQVFKTCGGCEQRSQWIRFPYTPVEHFPLRSNAERPSVPLPVSDHRAGTGPVMVPLIAVGLFRGENDAGVLPRIPISGNPPVPARYSVLVLISARSLAGACGCKPRVAVQTEDQRLAEADKLNERGAARRGREFDAAITDFTEAVRSASVADRGRISRCHLNGAEGLLWAICKTPLVP